MSTLAHVFEAAGLSTVVLASMRPVVEKIHPPRALYCEFPLGRPLGIPRDPEFQREVLSLGLALVASDEVPILVDHPVTIAADDAALACSLPPRYDPDLHPAVEEAQGLRRAYDRSRAKRGSTSVGRVASPDEVAEVLLAFDRIANGVSWMEAGLPSSDPISSVHDVRTYYEEAAIELVDGPLPGGRAAETWFYDKTEAGNTILAARRAMKADEAPQPFWFYMAPAHRPVD